MILWQINLSRWRLRLFYAAVLVSYVLAIFWIYPFFDLRKFPAFNSDSALVLVAATEHVPVSENLFLWGGARNGSALALAGKLFSHAFGPKHLLDFFAIIGAVLFPIGCSVFVLKAGEHKNVYLAIPAGLLLVVPSFATGITSASFAFTITDIAHRPEAAALLVMLSWVILSMGERELWTRRWWLHGAAGLVLGCLGAWVIELTIVATLLFGVTAVLRASVAKQRRPWETFVLFGCVIVFLQALRRISVYGSSENRQLYRVVDPETFRKLFPVAIHNLFSNLSTATWVVISVVIVTGIAALLIRPRSIRSLPGGRTAWHAINLILLGVLASLLPFGNNWVFGNLAHPRYFSSGALLLCVGVAQVCVVLLQQPLHRAQRAVVAFAAITLLVLPALTSGLQAWAVRRDLAAAGESLEYQASALIVKSGARAVIGPFWESYVYVIAAPGRIKSVSTDDLRISRTNTLRVLDEGPVAWVEYDPGRLGSVMDCRGVEFGSANEAPAVALPTHSFFRLYLPTGTLRIDCRRAETAIYFKHGWFRDIVDEKNPRLWVVGKVAEIEVPLQKQLRYRVEVVVAPAPGLTRPQEMTIQSGGALLDTVILNSEERVSEMFVLPPSAEALRRIDFKFAETATAKALNNKRLPESSEVAATIEQINFSAL